MICYFWYIVILSKLYVVKVYNLLSSHSGSIFYLPKSHAWILSPLSTYKESTGWWGYWLNLKNLNKCSLPNSHRRLDGKASKVPRGPPCFTIEGRSWGRGAAVRGAPKRLLEQWKRVLSPPRQPFSPNSRFSLRPDNFSFSLSPSPLYWAFSSCGRRATADKWALPAALKSVVGEKGRNRWKWRGTREGTNQ